MTVRAVSACSPFPLPCGGNQPLDRSLPSSQVVGTENKANFFSSNFASLLVSEWRAAGTPLWVTILVASNSFNQSLITCTFPPGICGKEAEKPAAQAMEGAEWLTSRGRSF